MKVINMENSLSFLRTIRDAFRDKRDKYEEFLQLINDFKAQRINKERTVLGLKQLFKGHPNLILGFNAFMHSGFEITPLPEADEVPPQTPAEFVEALNFVNKIKTRFQDDNHMYKLILNILIKYRKENKSITEVYKEVSNLLRLHQDLVEEFKHFMPDSSSTNPSPTNHIPSKRKSSFLHRDERNCAMHKRPKIMTYSAECDLGILKCSYPTHDKSMMKMDKEPQMCSGKGKERKEGHGHYNQDHDKSVMKIDKDQRKHASKEKKKEDRQSEMDREKKTQTESPADHKVLFPDKDMAKSISEIDLSECPGYRRLLPEEYPTTSAIQRTELKDQVLNNYCVLAPSGCGDYFSKRMHKNQHEEIMFKCEDDRFEMDMLLVLINGAKKKVEELLEKINNNTFKSEGPLCIESHFKAQDISCIEHLYGDYGLDLLDLLRNNATLVLPVILSRLKQKQEEWSECHSEFNVIWAGVYVKNHHKSLDHRSFCSQQQGTKGLSPNDLSSDLKEINENNPEEEDVLLVASADSQQLINSKMEFESSALVIHEDLCQHIKDSRGEVCKTTSESDKFTKNLAPCKKSTQDVAPKL